MIGFWYFVYQIEMEWKPHPLCPMIESGSSGFTLEIPLNHKIQICPATKKETITELWILYLLEVIMIKCCPSLCDREKLSRWAHVLEWKWHRYCISQNIIKEPEISKLHIDKAAYFSQSQMLCLSPHLCVLQPLHVVIFLRRCSTSTPSAPAAPSLCITLTQTHKTGFTPIRCFSPSSGPTLW